jgi:hypothetical protein
MPDSGKLAETCSFFKPEACRRPPQVTERGLKNPIYRWFFDFGEFFNG